MEKNAHNILDRNRYKLIEDQQSDITLEKARSKVSQKPPEEADGYFIEKELLLHRKCLGDFHNAVEFVDRIVVPEAYRNEILHVGHIVPLAGHMGSTKALNRKQLISFGRVLTLMFVNIVQPAKP